MVIRKAPRRRFEPFRDFVGPARRRTDHPLVVATIVLCLGLITVAAIIQIAATFWAGSQVKLQLDGQRARDLQTEAMRTTIIKHGESQAIVLRRLCLNVSKTDEQKQECLALAPPISPTPKETPH